MSAGHTDGSVVVIGAGIAGLWTALSLAPRPVTIVTASRLGSGSSAWAQGGLAAAIGDDDSPEDHARDTIAAGAGLCDPDAVNVLADGGPAAVEALASLGVPFDKDARGSFTLGREAAHSCDRIVHVGGDEAGAAIINVLTQQAQAAEHITIREGTIAERLYTDEFGIVGVQTWDRADQCARTLPTRAAILATGGLGGLYAVTTNPLSAQGHGLAIAAEAGAELRDLEFVQFHPTGLDVGRDPAPLATEAIRGAGGILVDGKGKRFMTKLHPSAELAPRDVVARGVAQAIAETGAAGLDVREALGPKFGTLFPTVAAACYDAGLDPAADVLPIAPAAHYHMGGVRTDTFGRTNIAGLYAVGEVASSGVHGANRLASNSLLEAIVFGTRIGTALAEDILPPEGAIKPVEEDLVHAPATDLARVRRMMTDDAGMLRDGRRLSALISTLQDTPARSVGDHLDLTSALLVARSALARQESRGAHQRSDWKDTEKTARHSLITLTGSVVFEDVHP
ncbi:MAG: L-aspartate oxidase [Pseudomonadota bacterium]